MLQPVFVIIFVQNKNFIMVSEVVRISRNRENLTVIESTTTTTTTDLILYHGVRLVVRIPETEGKILQ